MALIDKDGHNFWLEECSSVRFEACFEFPAKSLHKERKKGRYLQDLFKCSCIIQQIFAFKHEEFSLKRLLSICLVINLIRCFFLHEHLEAIFIVLIVK